MFAIRTGNATRFGKLDVSGSTVRTTAGWPLTSRAKEQGPIRGADDLFVSGAEREAGVGPNVTPERSTPVEQRVARAHARDLGVGDPLAVANGPPTGGATQRLAVSIFVRVSVAAPCGRRR